MRSSPTGYNRPKARARQRGRTALMIPKTYSFREAYGHLKMPVAIVAGSEDRLIEAQQSAELHRNIAHSTFRCVPSTGHMVHQTATAEVMSAIDMVATEKKEPVSEIAKAESRHRGQRHLKTALLLAHGNGLTLTSSLTGARITSRYGDRFGMLPNG